MSELLFNKVTGLHKTSLLKKVSGRLSLWTLWTFLGHQIFQLFAEQLRATVNRWIIVYQKVPENVWNLYIEDCISYLSFYGKLQFWVHSGVFHNLAHYTWKTYLFYLDNLFLSFFLMGDLTNVKDRWYPQIVLTKWNQA